MIELGSSIVVIKLGDQGLFLQTAECVSSTLSDRAKWQHFDWNAWDNIKLSCPCFEVQEVKGTTGAGDSTIAGFLMALLRGCSPQQVLQAATFVGARCVESPDATSNIPAWEDLVSHGVVFQQ